MEAAQHAAGGAALVVLHELFVDAGSSKLILLVGLHKMCIRDRGGRGDGIRVIRAGRPLE